MRYLSTKRHRGAFRFLNIYIFAQRILPQWNREPNAAQKNPKILTAELNRFKESILSMLIM